MQDVISKFADLVSLLYHEGRNVRHLIKDGKPVEPKYLTLRDRLATNRYEAWKQIQPLRQEAAKAKSATSVVQVFEHKFKLTLDDMVSLFSHQSW